MGGQTTTRVNLTRRQYATAALTAAFCAASSKAAFAQAAGTDIGAAAQKILTYLGGAAGGYVAALCLVVCGIMWGTGILSGRHVVETVAAILIAWTGAYMVTTTLGW
jgi:type IV secretory pathway VirB2 component (pilin)